MSSTNSPILQIKIFAILGSASFILVLGFLILFIRGPQLTQEYAREAVQYTWGGCGTGIKEVDCDTLYVNMNKRDGLWYVIATYEGMKNDSIAAERRESLADYYEDNWFLRDPVITHRCQPGRGHQDFSSEPCL